MGQPQSQRIYLNNVNPPRSERHIDTPASILRRLCYYVIILLAACYITHFVLSRALNIYKIYLAGNLSLSTAWTATLMPPNSHHQTVGGSSSDEDGPFDPPPYPNRTQFGQHGTVWRRI